MRVGAKCQQRGCRITLRGRYRPRGRSTPDRVKVKVQVLVQVLVKVLAKVLVQALQQEQAWQQAARILADLSTSFSYDYAETWVVLMHH